MSREEQLFTEPFNISLKLNAANHIRKRGNFQLKYLPQSYLQVFHAKPAHVTRVMWVWQSAVACVRCGRHRRLMVTQRVRVTNIFMEQPSLPLATIAAIWTILAFPGAIRMIKTCDGSHALLICVVCFSLSLITHGPDLMACRVGRFSKNAKILTKIYAKITLKLKSKLFWNYSTSNFFQFPEAISADLSIVVDLVSY